MEHMIEATIRLLHERRPDQITVRDVAEASGHHHRFVQAWFGGKVGLFRAAFDRIIKENAERIPSSFPSGGALGPETHLAATLMNWLVAAEPGSLDAPRPTPVIDQVAERYRADFGFDAELARLMALRVVSAAISATLFTGPLGITDADIGAMVALEGEIATLLAAGRGTR